ncbi:hypothetical protein WR25_26462 [Diploscapter pachys]|uniref:Uncharacterized protein n=1 Tax=Diploscapter pachys TaxID=2018661 RepID=A0A2A2JD96_9BILA|nr:hypothetical protein WR25_26462 [Diploscapter pachys]
MDSEQSQNNETLNMNDDDNEESQQDWSTISGTPPLIVAEEPDEDEHIPESSTSPPQLNAMEKMEDLPVEACKEEPMDETSATPAPIEPPQIVIEASQKAEDGINAVEEKPPVLTEQSQSTNREVDENQEIISHVEGSKTRETSQKFKTNLLTVCRRELENSTSDSEADTGKSSQNLPTQRSSSEEPVRRLKSPNLPQRTNFVKFVSASLEKKVESDSNAPHGNQTRQESSKDEAIISTPRISLNENMTIQEDSVASALQETPPISSSTPEPAIGKSPNVPTPGFSIFVDSPVSRKKQMERGNSFDRSSEKKTPVSSPIEMPNQFKYSPIIQNPETSPVWGSKFVQNPSPVELPRPTRPPIDRPSRLSSQPSDSPAKSSPISKPSPISRSSFRRSDEQKSGRKSSATPKNGSRFRYYNVPKRKSSSNSSKENAKLSREEREDIQKKKARRKTRLDAAVKKQELEFPWRELDGPADPDDPNFTMKDLPRWGWGWVRYKYRRNSSTQILNQHVDLIPSRCVLYRADDRQQAIVAQHEMNRRFYTNKDNKKSPSLCRYETQRQQAPLVARMLGKAKDETQIYSFMHLEKIQRDDTISNMDNGTDGVHSSSALEVKPLKFSKNDFAGLGKMDFVRLFACILCARIMKNPVCCFFNFNMNTRYYLPQPHEISSDEEELEEIFDLYGYTEEEKQAYLSASNQLPFPKIPKCDANFWRNCYERNGTMWNKEDSEPEDIPWKSVVSAVPLIDAQQMVPPDYELGHLTPSQRLRAYAHDYKKFQCNRRHMWPIVRRPDDAFWKRFFIRRKLERITGRVKHSSDEDLNESDLSDMDSDANELNKSDREVRNKACQYSDDEYKPFKWPPSVNPNVRRPYRRRRPFSVLSESRVTSRASEQQNDGKKQPLQISSDFMDEETEHSNLEAPPLLAYSDHLSGLDREGNDTPNSTTSGGDAGAVRRSTRPRKMTARAQRFRDTTTPKSNASGDEEYLNQPTKSRKRAKELQPTSGRNTADGGIGSGGGGQLKLATHRRSKRVVPKRYNQDEWAQELSDEDDGNDTEEADEDMRRLNVHGRGNNMLSWSGGKQICIPSNNEDDMFDDRSPVLMKMKATGLSEQGQMDAAGNIYVPNVQMNDSSGVQSNERAMPENLMDAVRLGNGSLEDTNARKGLMEELFRAKKRGRPSRVELEARRLKIQRYIEEHIIKNTDILKRNADCMKPFDEGLDELGASADSSSMMDAKRSRMETDPGSSQYKPLPPVPLKPQNLSTSAASSSSVSVNPRPSNQNSSSGNLKSPIASPERVEKAQELKQSQSSESLGSKSSPKSSPSKRSSKAGREEETSDSERGDRKTKRGRGRAKCMSTAEELESEEGEETTPQKRAGRKRTKRDSSEEYSDEGTIKGTRPQRAKRANKSFKEESDESDEPRSPITRGRKISQDRKRISTNQEMAEEASKKNDEKHMKDKAPASAMLQLPASAVPPSLILESSMERKNSSDASPPKLIAQSSGEATDNSDEMPVLQRMEPTPTESVSQPKPELVQQQQQTSQPNVSQSPSTAPIQQQCGVIQPYSTPTFLFQTAPDKMSTYQFLPGPDGTFQDYYPSPGSSIGPIDVHLQSISSGTQKIVKALPFRFENSNKQSFFRFAVPIEELQSPSNQFAGIMSPSNNVNLGSSTSQLNTPPANNSITITLVDGAKSVKEVLRDRVQMKQFNPRASGSSKLKQHERSSLPASAWIATFHPEFTPVLFGQTSSLQQSTDPDQNAFSPLPSSFERTSISGKSKAKFALSVKTTSKNDDIYSFEFPHVALPFDLTLGELRARRPDKTTFLSIFYSIRDKNVEDWP